MSKRLISMLTVFTMLMTMLSGAALAVSEDTGITNEARLNAAIEAAEEGGTVTLEGNIELTKPVVINKEITLDLGGHTISADFEGDYGAIYVGMAGDLTLTNGTVTSANTYAVGNYGTLTLDGVTLQCEDEELASLYNFYYNNETYGKTTVTEGVLGTVWNCGEFEIVSGTFDYIDNSGYMAVADATINGIYGADGTDASGVEKCGTIELAGGEVVLGGDAEIATPIVVTGTVTLDMNGKTISNEEPIWNTNGDNKDWSLISVQGGKLTITGEGTLAPLANDCYSVDVRENGEVTIENGTIGGNISAVYVHDGVANINGGTYSIQQKSEFGDARYTLNCLDANFRAETADIIVTGGTFENYNPSISNSENPEAVFVADGYEAEETLDDEVVYYTVGAAKLDSEAELLAAIAKGGEVKLEGDIKVTEPVVIGEEKTVTLDMNSFKIYNETDIWNTESKDWSLISVQGGKLTITGNGELAPLENDCYSVDVRNGGEVTIENGTIGGNISAVYVHDGVANINGGTYSITQLSEHADERFTLNCLDENYVGGTAKIIVKGGTFNKFNPAENLAEGAETNFVAEGFEATAEGDVYTVSEIAVTPPEIDPPVEDDPPAEDDDDDYTPVVTPSVTVKDEKGNAVEFEKQADGTLVVETEEDTEFTVDTRDGKDAVVKYETEGTNYGLVAVIVNEDGTETVITDTIPTENGIEFAVKDGQTVKIVDKTEVFDDVNTGDWNHDAVTFAAARGIVNGVGDNKFEPSTAATRGMVMTMLARLEGVDTANGETWFSEGMDWAKENGISDGTSPEAVISREQLIVMLWRLEGEPKANGNVNGFDDGADISAWALEAMEWAVESGLVQGNDNQLMPQGSANRDQVAQILMNFILMK
ncbi:MAG: S-layer homology domain-containing protein [Clostridia bacterium]|nr:S-layer homology domain-containing protein [Clostridia bacterium]